MLAQFISTCVTLGVKLYGGESRDFRGLKMADTCQNPSFQVRLSLIFPLIQIRLTWGLRQIPRKNEIKCRSFVTFRQRSGEKCID